MSFNNLLTTAAIFLALLSLVNAKQTYESYENNFYIILSASKFYFNYRHSLNAIIFYQYLKNKGISDDNILLMIPTDHACSPRNFFPGTLYAHQDHTKNQVCEDVEVDYKAEDLTEHSIMNMLRGRYEEHFPKSKKLLTNSESRIFIYWNGHGGENFFKI